MPSHQIPREKFVLGKGSYSSWLSFEARISDAVFEIVPSPLPVGQIVSIGLFVLTFMWLMAYGFAKQESYILALAIVVFGLFTLVMMVVQLRSGRRSGIVFRFDRQTSQISLPDRNLKFGPECRLSFAFIISPIYSPEGYREDIVAELQLVVESAGKIERYSIAQGLNRSVLEPLVEDVHRHVGLPIHEIEHGGFLQPKVYEKMFGQD